MKTKKSLFIRATALITAVVLMLTGAMDYSFALTEKDNILWFDDSEITDFYAVITPNNGEGDITIGKKDGVAGSDGSGLSIDEVDTDSVSLIFRWSKASFNDEEKEKLKAYNGVIAVGKVEGLNIPATKDDPALYDGALYWVENGILYTKLPDGVYDNSKHDGGYGFTGTLDKDKIIGNGGKLQVGEATYTFDIPDTPPTTDQAQLFVQKNNNYTTIAKDPSTGDYYQDFTVTVYCTGGDAENVVLVDELGEWFDGIYNIYVDGQPLDPSNYSDNPPTIKIGNMTNGQNVTVTYRAKISSKAFEDKSGFANYNGYNGENDPNYKKGLNTVTAKGDNVDDASASAFINVNKPSVKKEGSFDEGRNTITWTITVTTNELFGDNFTLSDIFENQTEYSKYIDLNDLKTRTFTKDNYDELKDNGDGTYTYTFTFETKLKDGAVLEGDQKITITNKANLTFNDFGYTTGADASADIYTPENTEPKPTDKQGKLTKRFVKYEKFDETYNGEEHYYLLDWEIEYVVPDGIGEYEYILINDWVNKGQYVQDNFNVTVNNVKVNDNDLEIKFYTNNGWNFDVYLYNAKQYKPGDIIRITYQTEVTGDISGLENWAWDQTKQQVVTKPPFATHKSTPSIKSNGADFETEWIVYVESESVIYNTPRPDGATDGFYPGDVIVITDIIPEGLTLDTNNVFVGCYQWYNFNSLGTVTPVKDENYKGKGTKYTFTFTIPSDNWWWSGESSAYFAIKYTTKLDADTYKKIASGELDAAFTNHASATVTREGVTHQATPAESTLDIDSTVKGQIISKTAGLTKDQIPNAATSSDYELIMPYTITVNSEMEKLCTSGDGTIQLVDKLGKRLSLKEDSIEVTATKKDGTQGEVSWTYVKTADGNILTFTLQDETKYVINYKVVVDYPTVLEKNKWDPKDFDNTATLTIVSNDIESKVDGSSWVKVVQSGFYSSLTGSSDADFKNVELEVTKKWIETTDVDHKIEFTIDWELHNSSDGAVTKTDTLTATYITSKANETFTLSGDALPAVVIENGSPVSYFTYTVKEVKVYDKNESGKYVEADGYTVSYHAVGAGVTCYADEKVEIDCSQLDFAGDDVVTIGITVENTAPPALPDTISITVDKKWLDDGTHMSVDDLYAKLTLQRSTDNFRNNIEPVTVDNNKVEYTVEKTANSDGTYTYTFSGLLKYADDAKTTEYSYRVVEAAISGYITSYDPSTGGVKDNGKITVTNTLETYVEVEKVWHDGQTSHPDITLTLYRTTDNWAHSEQVDTFKLTQGTTSHKFTGLPKYAVDGTEYTYKVEETVPGGYIAAYAPEGGLVSAGGKVTITNTLTADITVEKIWIDGNSSHQDITLTLYRTIDNWVHSEKVETFKLPQGTTSHKFTGLPKYDGNGNPYTYKVEETVPNGYIAAYAPEGGVVSAGGTVTITNTQTTNIEVTKVWYDGGDTSKRLSLESLLGKLTLYRTTDNWATSVVVPANEYSLTSSEGGNKYTYIFTGLPKYDSQNREYTYKVTETEPDGYIASYDNNGGVVVGGKATVYNTLKTSVKVNKKWNDGNAATHPTVTFELFADGVSKGTVKLENGTLSYTWENLPKYDVNNNGKKIEYTVEEVGVEDNKITLSDGKTYEVSSGHGEYEWTYTNTLTGTIDIEVTKKWYDDGTADRTKISFKLQRKAENSLNGQFFDVPANEYSFIRTENADGTYTYKAIGLAKYDPNGYKYTYLVVEEGYGADYVKPVSDNWTPDENNNYKITVTNTQKTSVKVTKEWVDNESSHPETEVTLYAENYDVSTISGRTDLTVKLKDGALSHTWDDLPKYYADDSGNKIEIVYKVKEENVNGNKITFNGGNTYVVSYDNSGNDWTVKNTLTATTEIEVIKVWKVGDSTTHPAKITLKLEKTSDNWTTSEVVYDRIEVTLTENGDGKYSYTFTDLAKYDSKANLYTYRVTEIVPEGYTAAYAPEDGIVSAGGTVTITNTLTGKTEIEVTKVWYDDVTDRPQTITLKLERTANGKTETVYESKEVTLTEKDGKYTYTFTGLDKYDEDGYEYTYKVTEIEPEGYTASYDANGGVVVGGKVTVYNTLNTSVTVNKKWNAGGTIPDVTVTFRLTGGGKNETVTLPYNGEWTYTWDDLPKYDVNNNGKKIEYTVEEVGVDNNKITLSDGNTYKVSGGQSADYEWTYTNTLTDTVDIEVTKKWYDDGTADRTKISFKLQRKAENSLNDQFSDVPANFTYTVNGDGTYTYKATGLDKYDNNGYKYTYLVVEEGYEADYVKPVSDSWTPNESNGYTITVTNIQKTSVKVTKEWVGNVSNHPTATKVTLYAENYTISGRTDLTVELKDGALSHTWNDLPKYYADGSGNKVEIAYKVKEVNESGNTITFDGGNTYAVEYVKDQTSGEWTVRNTLTAATEIEVIKVWKVGGSNHPATITLKLERTSDGWTTSEIVHESITVTLTENDDGTYSYKFTNLDKYDGNANPYTYRVTEIVPAGYAADKEVQELPGGTVTITNTLTGKTEIEVVKVWYDDGTNRPQTITLKLERTANGKTETVYEGKEVTLAEQDGKYTYKFTDLDKYDEDGYEYTYKVTEIEPEGYTASYDENEGKAVGGKVEITNTQTTDITVNKVWRDGQTSHQDITLTLYRTIDNWANSEKVETAVLTGDKTTYKFEGLPKYDSDGTEYTYKVEETVPDGYTAEYEPNGGVVGADGTVTITNKLETEVTVNKVWHDGQSSHQDITLTLYRTIDNWVHSEQVDTVTLTGGKTTYKFEGLLRYAADGTEYTYKVEETVPNGYTAEYAPEGGVVSAGETVTITNTLTTNIEVTKVWYDGGAASRPAISFNLYRSTDGGITYDPAPVPVSEYELIRSESGNTYTYLFIGLPRYDSQDREYTYKVTEAALDDYITSYSTNDGVVVNGEVTVYNTLKTSVTVNKKWNAGGTTPDVTVTFKLTGGGKNETVMLPYNGKWTYTWDDLPMYDETGKITYNVEEVDSNDKVCSAGDPIEIGGSTYTVSGGKSGDYEWTYTNTLTDTVDIEVTKEWHDDGDPTASAARESISFRLQRKAENSANGKFDDVSADEYGYNCTVNEADGTYKYTFTGLDKYDQNGYEYTYLVTEEGYEDHYTKPSYKPGHTADNNNNYQITVTNTQKTSVTVVKKWDMGDSGLSTDDLTVTVILTGSDGSTRSAALTVDNETGENEWSYTWENLPKYYYDDEAGEVKEIAYTVEENDVNEEGKVGIGGNTYEVTYGDDKLTITNKLTGMISVTVNKEWNDGGAAAHPSIKVALYAGDSIASDRADAIVTLDGTLSYTWNDLPKRDENGEIAYSVKEVDVDENNEIKLSDVNNNTCTYKVTCEETADGEWTITNTLTTDITVEKVWNDGNSASRPAAIYLTLERTANGKTETVYESKEVTLAEKDGKYTCTFTNLPKYDGEGHKYTYKVTENEPDGYTASYAPNNGVVGTDGTVRITNTLTTSVEVQKEWSVSGNHPSVKVALYAGDSVVGNREDSTVELKDGEWTYVWKDLPQYDANGKIKYSVKEVDGNGKVYEAGAEIELSDGNTYKVTYGTKDGAAIITNTKLAPLKLKKTDSTTGNELADATLVLSKVTDNGSLQITTWTSAKGGSDTLYLEDGEYILEETASPDGYQSVSAAFRFTVKDGAVIGTDTDEYALKSEDGVWEITVKNTPTKFNVRKTDAEEKDLSGANLILSSAGTVLADWTSDGSKEFNIAELLAQSYALEQGSDDNGAYYIFTLEEKAAPEGYELPEGGSAFIFRVYENGDIVLSGESNDAVDTSGNTFILINRPTEKGDETTETSETPEEPKEETPNNDPGEETSDTDPEPESTPALTTTEPPETTASETTTSETTPPETTTSETTAPEATTSETAPPVFTPAVTTPGASFEDYPPEISDDRFNLDNDGLPSGNQSLTTDDESFNLDDDGLPRGDMNLPTGVVIGGATAGAAVISLITAAMAQTVGKRRRGKKK